VAPRPFGHYEVLARLATGGAANIFLARREVLGGGSTPCVLKTLLPERAADNEFVEMFLDEARLASRFSHPACVEIFDVGKEEGTHFIAMEYVAGETLWALLGTVPETRTALPGLLVTAILAAACEGLHHAHELTDADGRPYNLVHRDVSPQNIMISYTGQTKVLDFGIAKAQTGREATATGIVKGKFSYMSPEQITGGVVDRRSDVYALGIVLFECLATRRLYRSESPEEIAKMMLEKKPPRLRELVPDIDPALDAICAKALARHPSNRYATAAEMAAALRDHLHQQRLPEGNEPIAALIEERFGPRIEKRQRAVERAMDGQIEEEELLRVLDARAPMDVDLFPSDDGTYREMSEFQDETANEMKRQGYRLEFEESGARPPSIRLADTAATRLSVDDGDGGGATRLDGDNTQLEGVRFDDETEGDPGAVIPARRPQIEEVPVAQPRRKADGTPGVRTDPRSPTRMLPPARPPLAAPSVRRGSSSVLTSPRVESNNSSSFAAQEPPSLGSDSPSLVGAAIPSLSMGSGSWSGVSSNDRPPTPAVLAPGSSVSSEAAIPQPPLLLELPKLQTASIAAPATIPPGPALAEPLSTPYGAAQSANEPQMYSLGVVLAALAFGVTLGLLFGVLVTLFTRPM